MELTTLLHFDTGENIYDNSDGAQWFGQIVALDFGLFELIKPAPTNRIHQ